MSPNTSSPKAQANGFHNIPDKPHDISTKPKTKSSPNRPMLKTQTIKTSHSAAILPPQYNPRIFPVKYIQHLPLNLNTIKHNILQKQ